MLKNITEHFIVQNRRQRKLEVPNRLVLLTKIALLGLLIINIPVIYGAAVLVKDGKSDYIIYHSSVAPGSVKLAAKELQEFIFKSTGARLPIMNEIKGNKFISLGYSPEAKVNGVTLERIEQVGFKIYIKNGNVFILGHDTPNGKHTNNGGISRGTLNGVYKFLEKYIDVRWVGLGELGESIVFNKNISIPDTTIVENPAFLHVRLAYLGGYGKNIMQWQARQRLNSSLVFRYNHAFQWAFKDPALREKHPEYYALLGKNRSKAKGQFQICTSNAGAVKQMVHFMESRFKKTPWLKGESMSPNDGSAFCECDKCQALDEKPSPEFAGRYTKRILTYYNEVADLLKKDYPDKWACGYVYQAYQAPPKEKIAMRDNVFLMFASEMTYGIKFYVPEVKKRWYKTLNYWSKLVPGRFGYYDLPTAFFFLGMNIPQPPSQDILNEMLPAVKKSGATAFILYGTPNWRSGAVINYVNAKMLWNPNADANALAIEFCNRAYGEKAGFYIKQFYDLLEAKNQEFILSNPKHGYESTRKSLKAIYADNFVELEGLFHAAETAGGMNSKQQRRLALFKFDMITLYKALIGMKLIDKNRPSVFAMTGEELELFCSKNKINLNDKSSKVAKKVIKQGFVFSDNKRKNSFKNSSKFFFIRYAQQIVALKSDTDEQIIIPVTVRKTQSSAVKYEIFSELGTVVKKGQVFDKGEIGFFARAGQVYYIYFAEGSQFYVDMRNIKHAFYHKNINGHGSDFNFLIYPEMPPINLYFKVPENLTSFILDLKAITWGKPNVAHVYRPDGNEAGTFSLSGLGADSGKWKSDTKQFATGDFAGQVWEITVDPCVSIFSFTFGKGLSGWFSTDPQNMLIESNQEKSNSNSPVAKPKIPQPKQPQLKKQQPHVSLSKNAKTTQNTSFESGIKKWSLWLEGGSKIISTTETSHTGTKCLKYISGAKGAGSKGGPISETIPILTTASDNYQVTGYVKVSAGNVSLGTISLFVMAKDSSGKTIKSFTGKVSHKLVTDKWLKISHDFTIPKVIKGKTVAGIQICMVMRNFPENRAVYIDDLKLTR